MRPRTHLGTTLARIGVYPYGLYLVHQPYAIYFAILVRGWSTPAAVAGFLPVLAVLMLVCMTLERLVNRTTPWLRAPTTMGATARAGAGSVPA